jgi:N-terminal domain of anti-restriction factor ArdC
MVAAMDTTNATNEERLAAAHAALTAAVARVATSEDWQNLLRISGSFHRYSPNNQLLLAAQGADGTVASFNTWKQVPATDGRPCQIRKGEKALRIYAPIRSVRHGIDEETGDEIVETSAVRFKLVPVFHEGQLAAPPDLPAQPKLLGGEGPPVAVWEAIADQINAAGFVLRRGPLDGPDGPKGVTNFIERSVTVRDDLVPAQALKTEIHELGHVLMHDAEIREPGMARERMEVEAESVAYVVCDILGVDAGSYSIPYVANWAGADVELVQATAQKVLSTARDVVAGLEAELGVDLRPDPLFAVGQSQPERQLETSNPTARVLVGAGTTDQIIHDHLATGPLNWQRLAASIPALEEHRCQHIDGDPAAQAIALAEAGASPEANATFLRAHGLIDDSIIRTLTVPVADQFGESTTLYPRAEVLRAVGEPMPIKLTVDALVADLLVSAGRHPAAARHLAEVSGQPASVINLMEERLRRSTPDRPLAVDRRANRGLSLIDEWTSADPTCHGSVEMAPFAGAPEPA